MRALTTTLLLVFGVLALAACASDTSASDDIVARVNDRDITSEELERELQMRIATTDQEPSPEEVEDLRLQLLGQLINDEILLQMAAEAGLTASDAEVEVKYNEFKAQYTEERLAELLDAQNMTVEDIRAQLQKNLTVEKLINKEITSKISVSEAEIQAFYDKNKGSFNLPESYRISHILVTPVEDPDVRNTRNDDAKTLQEAREKALDLLRQIQGGADFATIAREYSEDPSSAPVGGDLNFQPQQALENIDPGLGQAVLRLRTGETFPQVIETRFGFHIIRLLERDAGGQKDLSDARVQAEIRQLIFNRKDQTLKTAFSETMRNQARVSNHLAERILANAGSAQ